MGDSLDEAEHFGGACLVVADLVAGALLVVSDGFEEAEGSHADGVYGVFGRVKADADVGLGSEVVDFVGLDLF